MKSLLLALIAALTFGCSTSPAPQTYAPKDGDLLFQSLPHGPLIDTIEGSTHSPFSHCGIVVQRDDGWQVLEAIGPVRLTALGEWIAQGRGGEYAVRRFKPAFQPKVAPMIAAAETYLGRPYDIQYEMDDAKIYCSELIYKGFKTATGQSLGKTVKLRELDWQPYEETIREIAGGRVPLDREMITPRDLAAAEQLEAVLPMGKHAVGKP